MRPIDPMPQWQRTTTCRTVTMKGSRDRLLYEAAGAILAGVTGGIPTRAELRRARLAPAEYPITSGFFQCRR